MLRFERKKVPTWRNGKTAFHGVEWPFPSGWSWFFQSIEIGGNDPVCKHTFFTRLLQVWIEIHQVSVQHPIFGQSAWNLDKEYRDIKGITNNTSSCWEPGMQEVSHPKNLAGVRFRSTSHSLIQVDVLNQWIKAILVSHCSALWHM